jgi:hypothetical protein
LFRCPSRPWDESQASEGAIPDVEGFVVAFHQLALEWTGPEVESPARRNREHSAYCTTAMVRISHS